jgi:hypothetical protein
VAVAGISNEVLYQELLATSRQLQQIEAALSQVRIEMQKTLWECEYGRQRIDCAKRDYDEQLAQHLRSSEKVQ